MTKTILERRKAAESVIAYEVRGEVFHPGCFKGGKHDKPVRTITAGEGKSMMFAIAGAIGPKAMAEYSRAGTVKLPDAVITTARCGSCGDPIVVDV